MHDYAENEQEEEVDSVEVSPPAAVSENVQAQVCPWPTVPDSSVPSRVLPISALEARFLGAECGSQGCPVEPGRLPVQPAKLRGAAQGSCYPQLRLRDVHQLPARSWGTVPTLRRHICHTAQALHQGLLPVFSRTPSPLKHPHLTASNASPKCNAAGGLLDFWKCQFFASR